MMESRLECLAGQTLLHSRPARRRLGKVPSQNKDGELQFTADVAAARENGARMIYEIALP